jgi:hypothetical protein
MFILSMSLISKAFAPDSIFGRDNADPNIPILKQAKAEYAKVRL